MDVENNGKRYFLMDDLGGKPHYFSETSIFLPYQLMQSFFHQPVYYSDIFRSEFLDFFVFLPHTNSMKTNSSHLN